jgi:hypothetical protein
MTKRGASADRSEEQEAWRIFDARFLHNLEQVGFEEPIGGLDGRELHSDHQVVRIPDQPPEVVAGGTEAPRLRLMGAEGPPPRVRVGNEMMEQQQRRLPAGVGGGDHWRDGSAVGRPQAGRRSRSRLVARH